VVSTGVGSTSFEDDGDTLDGWSISGGAETDGPSGGSWAVGGAVTEPNIIGEVAPRSLERQPEILEEWASCRAGQTVTTDDFIASAEALAGQELSDLFEAWLFTPSKPSVEALP
jgi:hypothetical protein